MLFVSLLSFREFWLVTAVFLNSPAISAFQMRLTVLKCWPLFNFVGSERRPWAITRKDDMTLCQRKGNRTQKRTNIKSWKNLIISIFEIIIAGDQPVCGISILYFKACVWIDWTKITCTINLIFNILTCFYQNNSHRCMITMYIEWC